MDSLFQNPSNRYLSLLPSFFWFLSFSFLFFPLYTSAEHTMNETGRLCSEPWYPITPTWMLWHVVFSSRRKVFDAYLQVPVCLWHAKADGTTAYGDEVQWCTKIHPLDWISVSSVAACFWQDEAANITAWGRSRCQDTSLSFGFYDWYLAGVRIMSSCESCRY